MRRIGPTIVLLSILAARGSVAQAPGWSSAEQLLALDEAQLLAVFRTGSPAALPSGPVRGTPLIAPGTGRARLMSRGARVLWQGKVIDPDAAGAVNRFLGVRIIRGEFYRAPSWLDGAPTLVLDYRRTSHIYARYRDEIRRIGPGLYLGLMLDRTRPRAGPVTLFALEACR